MEQYQNDEELELVELGEPIEEVELGEPIDEDDQDLDEPQESEMSGWMIFASIIVLGAAGYLVYAIFKSLPWDIGPNWNMFDSPLCGPVLIFGFVMAIKNFGKNSYGGDTYEEITYRDGSKEVRKSNDIMDWMGGNIIMPFIGHFVLEPLFYGALVYYPLMCIWWLLHGIVPYLIMLLVVIGAFYFISFCSDLKSSYRNLIAVVLALLIGAAFGGGAYYLQHKDQFTSADPVPTTQVVNEVIPDDTLSE